ncbi:hypothetical protein LBMAG48_19700 [Phycisphaerae bacterium]|nr:hypothetical protein LBMAG48_19700 [Phycisphaerae bacterium]
MFGFFKKEKSVMPALNWECVGSTWTVGSFEFCADGKLLIHDGNGGRATFSREGGVSGKIGQFHVSKEGDLVHIRSRTATSVCKFDGRNWFHAEIPMDGLNPKS